MQSQQLLTQRCDSGQRARQPIRLRDDANLTFSCTLNKLIPRDHTAGNRLPSLASVVSKTVNGQLDTLSITHHDSRQVKMWLPRGRRSAACRESESGFTRGSCRYLQWVWQGQVHPGRLQSLCRSLSLEGLAQNEEVSGGQVPRGYPRQEVPVGSGDVSGMCLTTDIRTQAYQPRIGQSVQECSHS